jgi:hypothetical protein
VGARAPGQAEAAKADIAGSSNCAKLLAARDAYRPKGRHPTAVASAFVLAAEGKQDEALKALSAADAEDKTEKHPVTPGVPFRRASSGTMLLGAAWPTSLPPSSHAEEEPTGSVPAGPPRPPSGRRSGQGRLHYAAAVVLTESAGRCGRSRRARAFVARK